MPHKFYKHKLLFDENMFSRRKLPRLNAFFNIKHIKDDFHKSGISDTEVYEVAATAGRLIVTFNGDDFRPLVQKDKAAGVIHVPANMPKDQIDKKLTSLLL